MKAPHNAVGGFGLFTRAAVLPIWEAWDVFGLANGVADRDSLLLRLGRLSHGAEKGITIDDWIGYLAIAEPVFFPPDSWVPVPSDWSRSIVSGKGYDLTTGEGRRLYEACLESAAASDQAVEWSVEALSAARRGKPLEVRPRLGQATFRIAVLDAYSRRCAITGERSLPVIEASHIQPFSHGGSHVVSNGLPLRRDIHRLFDLGYVSVRPTARSRSAKRSVTNTRTAASITRWLAENSATLLTQGTEPTPRSWSGTTTRCFDSRSPAHRILTRA